MHTKKNLVIVQHFARAQSYLLSLAKGDKPDWLPKNVVRFINSQTSSIILQRRSYMYVGKIWLSKTTATEYAEKNKFTAFDGGYS